MKHAVNELKALLDTWGPQKEAGWNEDINRAIVVLENISETTMVMLDPRGIRLENISELKVRPPIVYPTKNITEWHNDSAVNETSRQEWLVSQGRSASSSWSSSDEEKYTASTVAEVEAGVPVGGRVAVPYNPEHQDYASKEYGASAEQIRACSERNQSEALADIESGRAERIDDDLGELDPSKACKNGEENCESCQ